MRIQRTQLVLPHERNVLLLYFVAGPRSGQCCSNRLLSRPVAVRGQSTLTVDNGGQALRTAACPVHALSTRYLIPCYVDADAEATVTCLARHLRSREAKIKVRETVCSNCHGLAHGEHRHEAAPFRSRNEQCVT